MYFQLQFLKVRFVGIIFYAVIILQHFFYEPKRIDLSPAFILKSNSFAQLL